MNISDLKQKIKKNDRLKRTVHYLYGAQNEAIK